MFILATKPPTHYRHLTAASCSYCYFTFSHSALLDISYCNVFFFCWSTEVFFPHETCRELNDWGNEWMTQNSRQTGARLTYIPPTPPPPPSLPPSLFIKWATRHELKLRFVEGVKCGRRRHSWMSCICKSTHSLSLSHLALLSQHN